MLTHDTDTHAACGLRGIVAAIKNWLAVTVSFSPQGQVAICECAWMCVCDTAAAEMKAVEKKLPQSFIAIQIWRWAEREGMKGWKGRGRDLSID